MTTILLARHGETDWNRARRWQGHTDRPLTDRGREQARTLAQRLAQEPLDAIYSSDLLRAVETARIVGESKGLPVTPLRELREVDVGSWSGLTSHEAKERFAEGFRRWWAYEGPGWDDGETYEEMGERVLSAIRKIAADHPGGRVLVVTHGGPIRALYAHSTGISYDEARRMAAVIDNCGLAPVVVEDGSLRAEG